MATNLSIDTELLNQALTEFVQRRKQREITQLFGALPIDDDYDYKKGRK